MPLLQFHTTATATPSERRAFASFVTETYAETMDTGTDHVAVVVDADEGATMTIGRAVDGPVLFLDAEIRRGRPFEYKRAFAMAVMERAAESLGVPEPNMKVVFTEHPGENMMGVSRVGGEWATEEE